MEKTMKAWQLWLSNILVGVIVGVCVLLFSRVGAAHDKNTDYLKTLAPLKYVDDRDAEIKNELCKKEAVLQTQIDKKVDNAVFNELKSSISDVKTDLTVIKNYLINNKDK